MVERNTLNADDILNKISALGAQTQQVAEAYNQSFTELAKSIFLLTKDIEDVTARVLKAYDVTEKAVEIYKKDFNDPTEFACKKSCAFCCHLRVMAPRSSLKAIAQYIDTEYDAEKRTEIVKKLQEAAGVLKAADDPGLIRRPCPFLDAESACTIYDVRPPSCRNFTSTNLKACEQLLENSKIVIPQHPATLRSYEALTAALVSIDAMHYEDEEAQQVDLSIGLLQELEKISAG